MKKDLLMDSMDWGRFKTAILISSLAFEDWRSFSEGDNAILLFYWYILMPGQRLQYDIVI